MSSRNAIAWLVVIAGGCHLDADDARTACPVETAVAIGALDWPMPSPPSLGLPHSASYDTTTSGVVVDEVTGLAWQQAVARDFTQAEAEVHCASLDLAGLRWRLPTVIELVSLVDDTKSKPAIDSNAFPDTPGAYFWTSTVLAGMTGLAWNVYFGVGDAYYYDVADTNAVRCVASGRRVESSAQTRCFTVENGTVYDAKTQLTWQQAVDPDGYDGAGAAAYCKTLRLGGGGWRLPRLNELRTIVDYAEKGPAVDRIVFPSTPIANFWTSSSFAGSPDKAWYVYFDDGFTGYNAATTTYRVRCVR